MWLTKDSRNLEDIFTPNIRDIKNIYHDKNIFTVEWTFSCTENNKNFSFDGVSLITFTEDKIAEIKEFESKKEHYRPYK